MRISFDESIGNHYVPSEETLARFRFWHVESLANQAADLLDRCLKERGEFDAHMESAVRLDMEIASKQQQTQLLLDRIKKGAHKVEHDTTIREWTGWKSTQLPLRNAEEAWLAAITNTSEAAQKFRDHGSLGGTSASLYNAYTQTDKAKMLSDLAFDEIARKENEADNEVDQLNQLEVARMGSLNFKNRAALIKERLEQDFRHAYDRLVVAADGLKRIYGYREELPGTGSGSDHLNAVTLWLRDVLQWLVAFSQLDQGSTHTISLRSLLGEKEWKRAIEVSPVQARFNLPAETFDTLSYVRLRGLSVIVVAASQRGPWKAEVRLPTIGMIRHPDKVLAGSSSGSILDQSDLPTCAFGRVDLKGSARQPEVCGLISLLNASPVSPADVPLDKQQWQFHLVGLGGKMEEIAGIGDILIELNIVARPL